MRSDGRSDVVLGDSLLRVGVSLVRVEVSAVFASSGSYALCESFSE